MENQMFPGHKVWGRGVYPEREAVTFLSFVCLYALPFPGRWLPRLDLSPSLCTVLETQACSGTGPWDPFRMLLYRMLAMCLCLKADCLNRNFFCLDFYSFNFFIYQPFKKLPLYDWESSIGLYTLLLETEFLFREVQSLSGFNLAIEREKIH